jgi:hypothetical protein
MLDIDIYSSGTSTGEYIKYLLTNSLKKAKLKFKLNEITQVSDFLKADITSVPTVMVGGKKYDFKENKLNDTLKNLISDILYANEYGSMNKIFLDITAFDNYMQALEFSLSVSQKLDTVLVLNSFVKTEEERAIKQEKLNYIEQELNKTWIGQLDNFMFVKSKVWVEDNHPITEFICNNFNPYFIITSINENELDAQLEASCPLVLISQQFKFNSLSTAYLFSSDKDDFVKNKSVKEFLDNMITNEILLEDNILNFEFESKSIVLINRKMIGAKQIILSLINDNPEIPILIV